MIDHSITVIFCILYFFSLILHYIGYLYSCHWYPFIFYLIFSWVGCTELCQMSFCSFTTDANIIFVINTYQYEKTEWCISNDNSITKSKLWVTYVIFQFFTNLQTIYNCVWFSGKKLRYGSLNRLFYNIYFFVSYIQKFKCYTAFPLTNQAVSSKY